jgi:hypothetical protein
MSWGIRRGAEHPTWGAVRLELGRLWLIWCASNRPSAPGHPAIHGHPFCWMIAWKRDLPEWDPRSRWDPRRKWKGSNAPGPFFKGCRRRRLHEPGYPLTGCKFPKCDCGSGEEWRRRGEEFERREAEGRAYREEWMRRAGVSEWYDDDKAAGR